MSLRLFLIPMLLSSAACSPREDAAGGKGAILSADAVVNAIAAPRAGQPSVYMSKEANGTWLRDFTYKWPAAVSRERGLVDVLTADRTKLLAEQKEEAAVARKESPPDCPGCGNRSYLMDWKVVAETPEFLSLSGRFSTYTGGAHGMYGLRSLVWDRKARQSLDGAQMFVSPAALEAALGPKLCRALDNERARRRGGSGGQPVSGGGGIFDDCPHLSDATILVGSSTGRAFDRIGVWFGPYVAGAYAEGAYELNFPVDDAVIAAVAPQYAPAFEVKP